MLGKSLLKGKKERNKKSFRKKKSNFQKYLWRKVFQKKNPQSGAYHTLLSIIFAYGYFVE
jgi:hypothetical protein